MYFMKQKNFFFEETIPNRKKLPHLFQEPCQNNSYMEYYLYFFHTSFYWLFFTAVLVTASYLRCQGLSNFAVFNSLDSSVFLSPQIFFQFLLGRFKSSKVIRFTFMYYIFFFQHSREVCSLPVFCFLFYFYSTVYNNGKIQ